MQMSPIQKLLFRFLALSGLALAAACGGGGSDSSGTPTPPPTGGGGGSGGGGSSGGPTWTSGVYASASQFKNRCQTVRTGADILGDPYPDMAGSTLQENFWLRSWTHETYLWNDEVVDRNPANYNDRLQYFDLLRTTALTPSGREKDQFHFSQPTEESLEQITSTPTASYGAEFLAFSVTPPRDIRIAYVDDGTPAAEEIAGQANFVRGARILEIDGIDLVNTNNQSQINSLNDALFPSTAGQMHTFLLQDPGGAGTRTVMVTSANLAAKAVNHTDVIDTGTGKVGYVHITTFSPYASEEEIADAIADMSAQGVTDLVLDLRYNGGGLIAVASQLGYMVAGAAQTSGKVFEGFRFNDDAGNSNPVTGGANNPTPFYSTGLGFSVADGTPLASLNLSRVFILSTDFTCSASEAVINGLRGVDVEVVLIGGTTCGKPFGFYPEDNCGETYFTIQFEGVNDKGFGDYADGFTPTNSSSSFGVKIPGCSVSDDFETELGDETEGMLAAALQYRTTGSCPAPSSQSLANVTASEARRVSGEPVGLRPEVNVMRYNRDMRMPD